MFAKSALFLRNQMPNFIFLCSHGPDRMKWQAGFEFDTPALDNVFCSLSVIYSCDLCSYCSQVVLFSGDGILPRLSVHVQLVTSSRGVLLHLVFNEYKHCIWDYVVCCGAEIIFKLLVQRPSVLPLLTKE